MYASTYIFIYTYKYIIYVIKSKYDLSKATKWNIYIYLNISNQKLFASKI